MAVARIRLPAIARKGEVIEVRTLIEHPMETGNRRDERGNPVPRKILNTFTCHYNGREVVRANWGTAIAANPYFAFHVVADASGMLDFAWTDDDGTVQRQSEKITVL